MGTDTSRLGRLGRLCGCICAEKQQQLLTSSNELMYLNLNHNNENDNQNQSLTIYQSWPGTILQTYFALNPRNVIMT